MFNDKNVESGEKTDLTAVKSNFQRVVPEIFTVYEKLYGTRNSESSSFRIKRGKGAMKPEACRSRKIHILQVI